MAAIKKIKTTNTGEDARKKGALMYCLWEYGATVQYTTSGVCVNQMFIVSSHTIIVKLRNQGIA